MKAESGASRTLRETGQHMCILQVKASTHAESFIVAVKLRPDARVLLGQFKDQLSATSDVVLRDMEPIDEDSPLHVSLSRTVYLKEHQIELFMRRLHAEIDAHRERPSLQVTAPAVFVNDEKTRTFLAMSLQSCETNAHLRALVAAVDRVLIPFGLPVYYAEPRFHVSFAWCADNQAQRLEAALSQMPCPQPGISFETGNVFVKCGNKLSRLT